MVVMYSPFVDGRGRPLPIEKIRFEHLSQLKQCDEGHHVEYKLLLEDGGKSQLAKEITSFANCEGGWLIVGIDDKTKDIKPIAKQDYSQRIGKIATRISPMPEFSTRFLSSPEDKETGVLVIYVYEGTNAPYICNGSIYVRSGSSKEPIKPADRGNVEYLYERSNRYRKEIEDFCKRDFFFSYSNLLQRKATYPISSIYLKNVSSRNNKFFNLYANRDKVINFVKAKYDVFECVSYSMESIIFMHKSILPGTNSSTLVFELFYDWSCKITLPVGIPIADDKKKYKDIYISQGFDDTIVDKFSIADGQSLFNALYLGLILFEEIAKHYHLKEKDYAFCIEIENAGEVVPAFEGEMYASYVREYGIPYAHKETNKSKILFLRDYPKVHFKDLSGSLIADNLGAAFGFRSDSVFRIMQDANKKFE